jgi:hypothetical protein
MGALHSRLRSQHRSKHGPVGGYLHGTVLLPHRKLLKHKIRIAHRRVILLKNWQAKPTVHSLAKKIYGVPRRVGAVAVATYSIKHGCGASLGHCAPTVNKD